MLVGMLLRRLGMMDKTFTGYLNTFVFKVALPVLLFQDLASQDFVAAWDGRYVLFCFLATAASMVGIVLLARVLVRDVGQRGEFVQAAYRSSAAILGIAFIKSIYGSAPLQHGGAHDPGQRAAVQRVRGGGAHADRRGRRRAVVRGRAG